MKIVYRIDTLDNPLSSGRLHDLGRDDAGPAAGLGAGHLCAGQPEMISKIVGQCQVSANFSGMNW